MPAAVRTAPPLVIPIFLPQLGCPHQCVFCNQKVVTGAPPRLPSPDEVRESVRRFRAFSAKPRSTVQIAFFGGNFLGLPRKDLLCLLEAAGDAVAAGDADGIRFSTRPDTVHTESMDILRPYPVATVEIGAQSMNDAVLAAAGRGHRAGHTEEAVGRLQQQGWEVGVQLMIGLPGDDAPGALRSAERIVALAPDFVRIYPVLVLAGSRLAVWYRRGAYRPLSLAEAVDLSRKLYLLFQSHGIPVVRMGLHPARDLQRQDTMLAGPFHPAFGELVHSEIFLQRAMALVVQKEIAGDLCFRTHPRNVSRLRGHRNGNIEVLQQCCGFRRIRVVGDPQLSVDAIVIDPPRS